MVQIILLILIHQFGSCFTWYFGNKNTKKFKFLKDSQDFESVVMLFEWDQDLKLSERFFIRRNAKKETGFSISCLTMIEYTHYKSLIKGFGNILFAKEMTEYEIKSIYCDRTLEFLRISWINLDQTNSTCLMIQKLFKRYFSFPIIDNVRHLTLPIFKKSLSFHMRNIKFKDESETFKDQGNLLQIYNKKGANFNGRIILMCPFNPLFNPLIQPETPKLILQYIRSTFSGTFARFGAYIDERNFFPKTFVFYQADSIDLNDANGKRKEKFSFGNFRVITINPPAYLINLEKFLDLITDMAFYHCK